MENKAYRNILNDYFRELKVNPVKINIIATSDMLKTYSQIRSDQSLDNIGNMDNYNGDLVAPKNVNKPLTILLNETNILKSIFDLNYNWVGTIIHEATHALDFIEFRQIINAPTFDDLFDINTHSLFNCWTEFHARAMGQCYVMKSRKNSQAI